MILKLLKTLSRYKMKKAFELGIQEGKKQSMESLEFRILEASRIGIVGILDNE